MALINIVKAKCLKCGYGIPLTTQEHQKAEGIDCPKCSTEWTILRDDGELFLEIKKKL
jgi:Zn finger protein HypA/HybF involved in hydrogenase expression